MVDGADEPESRADRVRTVALLFGFSWLLPAFVGGYALLTMFEFHALPVPDFVPKVHEGLSRWVFDPWQHWDGQWFLRIAELGYYPDDPSAAFLPAYPSVIHGLAPVFGGDTLVAACAASWAAFAGALWLAYGLLREEIGVETTRLALVLLVAFPTAFFFHAAYTESLFLLASVAALSAARRGHFVVAGGAALVATLTRWTGFALAPALAVEAWAQATARLPGTSKGEVVTPVGSAAWRALASLRGLSALARVRPLAWGGAVVLPLLALPIVLRVLERAIGDPWGFTRAQRLWERRITPPWVGLWNGVEVLLPGHPPYLSPLPGGFPRLPEYPGGFLDAHAYNLAFTLLGLWLCVVAFRRLAPSSFVLGALGVVIPLMTPSRLQPLQSMPRFLVVAFPLLAALAVVLRRRPLAAACVIAAFAVLQGFFTARFTLWFWVA